MIVGVEGGRGMPARLLCGEKNSAPGHRASLESQGSFPGIDGQKGVMGVLHTEILCEDNSSALKSWASPQLPNTPGITTLR